MRPMLASCGLPVNGHRARPGALPGWRGRGGGRPRCAPPGRCAGLDHLAAQLSGRAALCQHQALLKVEDRTEYADKCTRHTPLLHLLRPPTSSTSRGPRTATWASRACIGCSTPPSQRTCRAIARAMGPRTWPSCAASPRPSEGQPALKQHQDPPQSRRIGPGLPATNPPARGPLTQIPCHGRPGC